MSSVPAEAHGVHRQQHRERQYAPISSAAMSTFKEALASRAEPRYDDSDQLALVTDNDRQITAGPDFEAGAVLDLDTRSMSRSKCASTARTSTWTKRWRRLVDQFGVRLRRWVSCCSASQYMRVRDGNSGARSRHMGLYTSIETSASGAFRRTSRDGRHRQQYCQRKHDAHARRRRRSSVSSSFSPRSKKLTGTASMNPTRRRSQ